MVVEPRRNKIGCILMHQPTTGRCRCKQCRRSGGYCVNDDSGSVVLYLVTGCPQTQCRGLLASEGSDAPMADSLCPAREKRTMRETEGQSDISADPSVASLQGVPHE